MDSVAGNWLQHNLLHLYEQQRHCDVTIRVETEEFPCHKSVLVAASDYFDTMFGTSMIEAESDHVTIKDVNPQVFENMLKYIYGDTSLLTKDNVETLLHVSNRFQILHLKSACEQVMVMELSIENCIGFWVTGISYACEELEKASWTFIEENFDIVRKSDDLNKLEKDEMMKIVKSEQLNVSSEEHVCDVALEWIRYDEDSRKQYFEDILLELRLCEVSLEYLIDNLFSVRYVSGNETCMKLLKKAIKYHALPERRHTLDSLNKGPRRKSSFVQMRVVLGKVYHEDEGSICSTQVIGHDEMNNKWYFLSSAPKDLGHEFGACLYGEDIYFSGGTSHPKCVIKYCLKSNTWQYKADMLQCRFRHCMVASRKCLYVVGGCNYGTSEVVERYDMANNCWQSVGDLRFAVDAPAATIHGDNIYIFGGNDSFITQTSLIQCFNTTTRICTIVGNLPSPQSHVRAVVYMKKTYLAFTNGDVYSYVPNTDLEHIVSMEDFDRKNFGFQKDDKSFFLIGGCSIEDDYDVVEHDDAYTFGISNNASDKIHHISSGPQSKMATLPLQLPVTMEVCGCFKVMVRQMSPLTEYKDMFCFPGCP